MNGLSSPNSKRGRLQRACLKILEAHRDSNALPTSARFIFYELVQAGIVSKHKTGARRPDQDVSDALAHLRNVEIVPWHWIVDETRSLSAWQYAATVADFLFVTVPQARLDLWDGDMPPIIIAESRSLAGVLHDLAALYLVPITATNGQVGGHLHTEIAPSLARGQRVLYLGDFDWQGGQIESNTRRVLEQLVGPLEWTRLAITADQAEGLPAIQRPDNRYKPVRYHDAVETEALGQSEIVAIVRDHLDCLLPEPIGNVLEREGRERERVASLLVEITT